MKNINASPLTIALWAVFGALVVVIILLAPGTIASYQQLQTEQNATPTPTANIASMMLVTFDPNNTPSPTPMVLKAGTVGDDVTSLQQRLADLGYYTGTVDGQYGPGTSEAVRLFQAQLGLDADGLAGAATLNALNAEDVPTYIPTPTPSPAPEQLQRGDKGDMVRQIQQRLADLGYYTTAVDGDYGAGTEDAVRRFQKQHGLPEDGALSPQALSLLTSDQAEALKATPTPDPAALPLLVNNSHTVPEDYRPDDLVNLRNSLPSSLVYVKGSGIEGDRTAVSVLQTMLEAAKADGVTGFQVSAGWRSVSYQQELFDKQVQSYLDEGRKRESAISATRLTVANPGASEHHTGLAFDMTVAGTSFKGTPQQIWLHEHCWDYGYIIRYQEDKEKITGIIAECWHIRYVGLPHSLTMRDKNLCLEEYLEMMAQ